MSPKGSPYIQPSQSDTQETPHALFDQLWSEFAGFDMDPACTPEQYTARRVLEAGGRICIPESARTYRTTETANIEHDGLAQPWVGKVWLNCPYGLALRKWTAKAVHEVECGNAELVMALVPSKTDTQWFQEHVLTRARFEYEWDVDAADRMTDVRFIKGRLTFEGFPAPAGHASAIVVWRR